ncbi:hypothetical protein ABIE45_004709 [Methylobacterium sp. OAE515]|uniref:uracil-DNA glycosylase family protein n=1 Tax=Methylobacterium sp. OAE515 TaxID=2817895 RepID=UPI00359EFDD4
MPLIDDLTSLAAGRNILPSAFACPSFGQCNASTNGNMNGGSGCSMSFVGSKYGSFIPKIVCIGIDHRDNISNDYYQRTFNIIDYYQIQGHNFNPHYKGVVKTAAAFLGPQGAVCNTCWQTGQCRKAANPNTPDCVLDRIVQPNLVKCVPANVVNANSLATPTMMTNCARHLLAELLLIRPRLAIFHGAKLKRSFLNALATEGIQWANIQAPQIPHGAAVEVAGIDMLAFFFHHPARSMLARQWDDVVAPCLDYLQQIGEIA